MKVKPGKRVSKIAEALAIGKRTKGGGLPRSTAPAVGKTLTDVKVADDEPEALGERVGGCQWMHGAPGERRFCGQPRFEMTHWCSHHRARVFVPVKVGE